jgi:hypothetical protein
MSNNTVTFNNGQQLQVNTNLAKLFPFEREQRQYLHTNSKYDPVPLAAGTLMVVNKSTGKVEEFDSTIHTANQYYFCILADDAIIDEGATENVAIAVCGTRVRQDMIVFNHTGDSLSTVVGDLRIFEWLLTCGIIPISAANCTNFDNAI